MRLLTRHSAPYWFLAPFALTFVAFTAVPLVKSLILAGQVTNGPRSRVWVGLDNLRFLAGDAEFWHALANTLVFTAGSLLVTLPVALALALVMDLPWLRARGLWRFAFFSPYLLGQVFTAVLFAVVFLPHYGLLNQLLHGLIPGFPIGMRWLEQASLIMPALILTSMWMYAGFNMVYFLAALQAVDRELRDAAAVDGANAWQRFRHITIPGIRPVLVFVIVLSTIGSLQLFELPWLMLNGTGPEAAGATVVTYLYQRGFIAGDLGFASAVGWVLALLCFGLSLIQLRLNRQGAR